jgi:twin arginine-targeting protein translocase, TatA/E family
MFSGPWEILLILAIALLLFGSKKFRTLGSVLGAGLKGFKKSLKDDSEDVQLNNNFLIATCFT